MQAIAKRLGLGKFRHYKGSDLAGNNYFEFENAMSKETTAYKATRRTVEYRQTKPLHEYLGSDLPPPWISWLRHTREEPPSMEEQQAEFQRISTLKANVAKLDAEYKQEKARIEEQRRASIASPSRTPTKLPLPPSTQADEQSEGESMKEKAASESVEQQYKATQQQPQVSELRQRAREEMMRKKREMSKSHIPALEAFRPAGAPDQKYQPESWQPLPRKR